MSPSFSVDYITVNFSAVGNTTWTVPAGVTSVEVLVVGGGGGGGGVIGGGGGAGGLIYNNSYSVIPGESINISVGGGGSGGYSWNGFFQRGTPGNNSIFGTLIAIGGGAGAAFGGNDVRPATIGGSGGGSTGATNIAGTLGQGYAGGSGSAGNFGGGGGGASQVGANGATGTGKGGDGLNYTINGSNVYYAGGGGGGVRTTTGSARAGGLGGGGAGGTTDLTKTAVDGINNTGGGGGGGGHDGSAAGTVHSGGDGGSGIVIVRYVDPYFYETFTTVGTTNWTVPAGVTSVDILVIGGGGAGGSCGNGAGCGGGGAGGFTEILGQALSESSYNIVVGDGGSGVNPGAKGGNSSFGNIISEGGGRGGGFYSGSHIASQSGGSGGGAGYGNFNAKSSSNAVLPQYGNAGGNGITSGGYPGGGGGGAGGAGGAASAIIGGAGGAGKISNITGLTYAGGGGAGIYGGTGGAGTAGGGSGSSTGVGGNAIANTGSGGGGSTAAASNNGGNGGSGIVILKYLISYTDGDDSQSSCQDLGYSWIILNSSSGRCCGDDGASDTFYNGSIGSTNNFCMNGSFINQAIDANSTICSYYGFNWLTQTTTSGNYARCCNDDSASDAFSAYNSDLSSSSSSTCERCNSGSYIAPNTYYGNGYKSGTTCYYGTIQCSGASGANGASCILTNANDACVASVGCVNQPTVLTATAQTDKPLNSELGKIILTWTDNSNIEDGFKIERSTDGTTFAQTATVGAGITTYTDDNLTDNTIYYYKIRSYKGASNSEYSSIANAITADRTGPTTSILTVSADNTNNKININLAENDTGLVLYMPFEENTGTTTKDWSTNNLTGTINGATWATGKYGKALSFNGINDHRGVILGQSSSLQLSTITILLWINPQNNGDSYFVYRGGYGGDAKYQFALGYNTGILSGSCWDSIGRTWVTAGIAENEWANVALVCGNNQAILYYNGMLVDNVTMSGQLQSSTADIYLGNYGSLGYDYKGLMDELRIYNRTLTQREIINDMQSGTPEFGIFKSASLSGNYLPLNGSYDDFSDGDYLNNPVWIPDSSENTWAIESEKLYSVSENTLDNTITLSNTLPAGQPYIFEIDMVSADSEKGFYAGLSGYIRWIGYYQIQGTGGINFPTPANGGPSFGRYQKILFDGTNFTFYVNNIPLHTWTTTSTGVFKLSDDRNGASSTKYYFDNVKITPLYNNSLYDLNATDTSAPATPSSAPTVTVASATSLNVAWDAVSDNGNYYYYYTKSFDNSGNENNLFSGNGWTFESNSLKDGFGAVTQSKSALTITSSEKHSGNYAVNFTRFYNPNCYWGVETTCWGGLKYGSGTGATSAGERLGLQAGHIYQLSFWYKGNVISDTYAASYICYSIGWCNQGTGYPTLSLGGVNPNTGGTWKFANYIFTVPANMFTDCASSTCLRELAIAQFDYINVTTHEEFYIDDIKLVEIKNTTITTGVKDYYIAGSGTGGNAYYTASPQTITGLNCFTSYTYTIAGRDNALNSGTASSSSAAKYPIDAVTGCLGNGSTGKCWIENTCYYTGPGCPTSTTLCSAGVTTCCTSETTIAEGVGCASGGVSGASYDSDLSQARCESSASGCTPRTWFDTLGTFAGSSTACCGDDTTSDNFSTYSGSLTSSTTVNCRRCNAGSAAAQVTLYGNGIKVGTNCYYGTITCTSINALNSSSCVLGNPADSCVAGTGCLNYPTITGTASFNSSINSGLSSYITLTWSSNGIAPNGYYLEKSLDGITFTHLIQTSLTAYTDYSATIDNTMHYYRIKAYYSTQNSSYNYYNITTKDKTAYNQPELLITNNTNSATITNLMNDSGLVLYMPFEENTGTITKDWSTNNLTGTISSGTTWTDGKYGKALNYNGNDYVNFGDENLLEGFSQITISAWIKPTVLSGYQFIVGKEAIYKVDLENNHIRFLTGNNWAGSILTSATTLTSNSLYYITLTYDGSVKKLYINGVLDSNTVLTTGALGVNTNLFSIGARGSWTEYFNGLIDEVRIYNRSLTQKEIINDMQSGTPYFEILKSNTSNGNYSVLGGFFDDFSDGVYSDKWTCSGSCVESNGKMLLTNTTGASASLVPKNLPLSNDFLWEAEVTPKNFNQQVMNFVFRQNAGKSYIVVVGGTFVLIYKVNGTYNNLGSMNYNFQLNVPYNFKIIMINDTIKVFLNNVQILNGVDSQMAVEASQKTMYIYGTQNTVTTQIDNVKITPLNKNSITDLDAIDTSLPNTPNAPIVTPMSTTSLKINWTNVADNGNTYYYYSKGYDYSGNEAN
ncbi:MAG: hypothetical protein PHY59_06170, partial [Methanobacterium sp.]|nr:hypothetical protein [Methanobacterium sp.]